MVERHAVGVYNLKPVLAARVIAIQNVAYVKVVVEYAAVVHAQQEECKCIEYVRALPRLGELLRHRSHGPQVRTARHEVTIVEYAVAARLDKGYGFGCVYAELPQAEGVKISPLGLAPAKRAVDNAVEHRQMSVSFYGEASGRRVEYLYGIASVMQRRTAAVEAAVARQRSCESLYVRA